jgi:hypothetical protein
MAKSQIRQYVFTPSTNTTAPFNGNIKVAGKYDLSQILLITNSTSNKILYNFADPLYSGTTVSFSRANDVNFVTALDSTDGVTTITFATGVDTYTGMTANDQIQVLYEKPYQEVRMPEIGTDAFERTRVSNPQSMLDADFEYGLQPTKWLTYSLMRGYPSVYEIPGTDLSLISVTTDASSATGGTGESLITVTTTTAHGLTAGTPVTVKGCLNTVSGYSRAEGSFIINSVGTPTTFTYYAEAKVGTTNGDTISTTYTQIRQGGFYTGSSVGTPTFTYNNGTSPSTITVTFANNHGFVPGDTVLASTSEPLATGPFFVESVTSATAFTYTARAAGTISGTITGIVYGRPDAYFTHRPFDGGVILGTGSPSYGAMAVRQSKKYIRYQSGKAVNYNTGALFAPNYDIRAITATTFVPVSATVTTSGTIAAGATTLTVANGSSVFNNALINGTGISSGAYVVSGGGTNSLVINIPTIASISASTVLTYTSSIQITTDDTDHGCQPGATVNISGVVSTGYNGIYTVGAIVDERNLLVPQANTVSDRPAAISDPCLLSVTGWSGSTVRAGTFDEQNGMFWQYDGQTLAVGRRSSTFQMAGTVAVTPDSNSIVGTNTRFASQLIAGDRIVIKGMTHVVSSVVSDTQIYVTPDYRGIGATSGVKAVKVVEYIIPQSQWNGDRLDGTNGPFNPSGYKIDTSKMQMIGLQWTWYGAGFIDWMLRGPEGKYITVHRLRNNNLNKEAYMRSGNQPVRYEVSNEGPRTYLTADPGTSGTSLAVADATFFPTSGTVYVDNELISYTTKNSTTLFGCTRAAVLSQFSSGNTRSFTAGAAATHAVNSGVILVKQTATPSISHWGSAFLSDGGFDSDRGYIFNYQSTNVQISTKKTTAFAIRLAPSVSNAIVGDLGVRELINRAQLLLQAIEITAGGSTNTNSAIVVEGILNPSNYPTNPSNITWNSLNSTALQTGQPSFSQIATGTSVTYNNTFTGSITGSGIVAAGQSTVYLSVNPVGTVNVGDDVVFPSQSSATYGGTKVTGVNTTSSGSYTGTVTTQIATATGSISGTTLTVTSQPSGGTVGFFPGAALSGVGIPGGTTIVSILSGGPTTNGSTYRVSSSLTVASTSITATAYLLTAIGSPTATPGYVVTGTGMSANTYTLSYCAPAGGHILNQLSTSSSASITFTLNSVSLSSPLADIIGGNSVITFSRNTYALPGETVFSFISSPSNKDSLDLKDFKELTNTPIGGRGTFPNGPDVLFINVYLTQGAPIQSNLVLRWSEAQA